LNQAEPCWFVFAVVNRRPPLVVSVGWLGEPFVSTWQLDAGVLLFAQTFVEVKPPTGKLNDCAVSDCVAEMTPMSSPTATKPPRCAVFILRSLRFSKFSQEWLAESEASFIRSGLQLYALV
jgi:hypothetical protein